MKLWANARLTKPRRRLEPSRHRKRRLASSAAVGSTRRPEVLIVDNNEVCRALVPESLELGGFDASKLDITLGDEPRREP